MGKATIFCASLLLIFLGYFGMRDMQKRAEKAIETEVFSEGLHKIKPVYGEEAIRAARAYARMGKVFFFFSVIVSILFIAIQLTH
jgi:hypothetical protein